MLLHSEDKNKIIGLIGLVVISAGIIVWQWANLSPWQKVASVENGDVWEVVSENTDQAIQEMRASFSLANYHINTLKEEFNKEQKKIQLLEATKLYVSENKTIEE
jgi:hypothetical protein